MTNDRSLRFSRYHILTQMTFLTVAFAARTELGDPKFIHNSKKLRELTTKKFAAQVRANITDVSHPLLCQ